MARVNKYEIWQAAPGGWSLYASKKIGPKGLLIAVDLLQLDYSTASLLKNDSKLSKFHTVCGDFCNLKVQEKIVELLDTHNFGADCIISDMAANFTGDKMTDALRTMSLCEDVLKFAAGRHCFETGNELRLISDVDKYTWKDIGLLRVGGSILCKFFACGQEMEKDLLNASKEYFSFSIILKPPASRKESSELYLFASGYKGNLILLAQMGR